MNDAVKPNYVFQEGTIPVYANNFLIHFGISEFAITCGINVLSEKPTVRVVSHVVCSPIMAKLLIGLLMDSVEQYERRFGVIPTDDLGNLISPLFNTEQSKGNTPE